MRPLLLSLKRQLPVIPLPLCLLTGMLPNSARPVYTPYQCLPEPRPSILSLKRQIPGIPLPLCLLTGMLSNSARPVYTPYRCLPDLRPSPLSLKRQIPVIPLPLCLLTGMLLTAAAMCIPLIAVYLSCALTSVILGHDPVLVMASNARSKCTYVHD